MVHSAIPPPLSSCRALLLQGQPSLRPPSPGLWNVDAKFGTEYSSQETGMPKYAKAQHLASSQHQYTLQSLNADIWPGNILVRNSGHHKVLLSTKPRM